MEGWECGACVEKRKAANALEQQAARIDELERWQEDVRNSSELLRQRDEALAQLRESTIQLCERMAQSAEREIEIDDLKAQLAAIKQQDRGDAVCEEPDGCPTEKAVLQRFWREFNAAPVMREQPPVEITEAMALSFHRAITDGSIGQDDVDEIMTGLRAAFANVEKPVMHKLSDEEIRLRFFRDLLEEQRIAVFKVFGVWPDKYTGKLSHDIERRLFAALLAASRTAGQDKRDVLSALEELVKMVDEPPAKACSCCVSPPCNDCAEYSGLRRALENARAAMQQSRGIDRW